MRRSFHLVRILILYILLEYNHGLKRNGCFINMSTIKVQPRRGENLPNKIKLVNPTKLPVQEHINTLEGCAQKCSSSTDTCYIMMFIEHSETCYIGGVEDFTFEPEIEHPTNYISYINLCGHRLSELTETGHGCYYKGSSPLQQSSGATERHYAVKTIEDCEKKCNKSDQTQHTCYGLGYQSAAQICELYKLNYTDIRLEKHSGAPPQDYWFKKCDTCLDHNCQHGGTCVPTTGTCCGYTCNCTDVNMVGDCDRCEVGLGIDKLKGECIFCGDKEIGNGTDCIPCDGDMVANWNNTECDVVASTTCSTPNTTWSNDGTTSAGNDDFPPWIKYKWHLTTVAINVVVLYGGLFGLWYWYNSIYQEICQYVDERIDKIQERASARSSTKTDPQGEPGYEDADEKENAEEQGEEGGGEEN